MNFIRMSVKLLGFVLSFGFSIFVNAQERSSYTIKPLPQQLEKLPPSNLYESNLSTYMTKNSSTPWVVYSDRDGNVSYSNSNEIDGKLVTNIRFLDAFYVVDVRGDFLELVQYITGEDIKGNKINGTKVKYYGWCKKENLILSPATLTNASGISEKILTAVQDKDAMSHLDKYIKDKEFVKFLRFPDLAAEATGAQQNMFDFLFVLKKSGDYYLVSKKPTINSPREASNYVLGWVKANLIFPWSNRLCLEPNSDPKAADERKTKAIKTAVFQNSKLAERYADNPQSLATMPETEAPWSDDPYHEGWNEYQRRWPVLNDKIDPAGKELMEIGYIHKILNEEGDVVMDQAEGGDQRRALERKKENIRKINIIFVLDGSMEGAARYDAVINGIQEMESDKAKLQDPNTVKYGVVIYRSDGDESCGSPEVSKFSLTSKADNVIGYLEQNKDIYSCQTGSEVKPRVVRKGLRGALDMLSVCERQTNYIILLGGAGDLDVSEGDLSDQALGGMISKSWPNFLAFQTSSVEDENYYYMNFPGQVKKIINDGTKKIANVAISGGLISETKKAIPQPDWSEVGPDGLFTFRMKYDEDFAARKGTILFPDGPRLPDKAFTGIFDLFIEDVYQYVQKSVNAMENDNLNTEKGNSKGLEYKYAINLLPDSKEGDFELTQFSEGKYQFLFRFYTTLKPNMSKSSNSQSLKHDIYNRVYFFTANEFAQYKEDMRTFANGGGTAKEKRAQLYNATLTMLERFYGEEEGKLKDMVLQNNLQVLMNESGLKTELSKLKLKDLQDGNKFDDDQVEYFQTLCANKLALLEQELSGKNKKKYIFKMNETTGYWIPESFLP